MRSKAHIKGHPLHPILVSFPISLLTGAFLLDLMAFFMGEESYYQAGLYAEIGGLVSVVFAAIPGIIDYYYVVPPESSAKERATKHALINSMATVLFVICLVLRLNNYNLLIPIVALEGIGVLLIGVAGWLGGTLLVRNQIGIDHRYAHAGKWKEENITTRTKSVELKDLDSLKVDQMKLFRVNGKRIVVAKTEEGLVAFEDRCTHRGASLADGVMICGTVQCPWHGSQFDIKNGKVKAGPAKDSIRTFELKTNVGKVILWI